MIGATKIRIGACLLILVAYINANAQADPDCSFITDNASGQITSSRCAPVDLEMEVEYHFMFPVDPAQIRILYEWNDGTNATDTVPAISQGDTLFSATMTHEYLPSDQCAYTAQAFIVIGNNDVCTSSSLQEQTFSAWGRDNENSGTLLINAPEVLICEGDDVDTLFQDASTFNCNIGIEPDNPNRLFRWVQFVYNTNNAPNLIPGASVVDDLGNIYPLTDAAGNFLNSQYGPVIRIPLPADGPDQTSWRITAPPNGVLGDYLEVTMRNWNICNAYDNTPVDGLPPLDTLNGDNAPIETTAYIRIVTTPPTPNNPSVDVCVNQNITLSTGGGNTVRWYADSLLNTLLATGINFNPLLPPANLDNSVPGNYSVYVTDAIGFCESEPHRVDLTIFDGPTMSDAGDDQFLCVDTTTLEANTPITGMGSWSTTGGASITNPTDPNSSVTNLDIGLNTFTWTITNGPCISTDEMRIFRDLQPAPAYAGSDTGFCDLPAIQLYADPPTNGGQGEWTFLQGSGSFTDNNENSSYILGLEQGVNILTWHVESANGGCIPSTDTIVISRDVAPSAALTGPPVEQCESDNSILTGNIVTDNGTGIWSVVLGSGIINNANNSISLVTGLGYGNNDFEWSIQSEFGICPSSSDTMTITRHEMPAPAITDGNQSLCNTLISDTLGANSPSVGNGFWQIIDSPGGSSPVFSPNINDHDARFQILNGEEGAYILSWNIENGTCFTSDTLSLDYGITLPPANAGPDTAICGSSIFLDADVPILGNGTWKQLSGKGTVSFTNINDPKTEISIAPGNEDRYLLEWQTISGSCSLLPIHTDTVEIYFKPMPGIPVAMDVERCGNGAVTLISNKPYNANNVRWYDSISGNTLLYSDTIFNSPVLSLSRSYYLSGYNDTSFCESSRTSVDVLLNPIPGNAISSDVQNCGSDSILLNALVGFNGLSNRWYENITDTVPVVIGNQYKTPVISSSRSYWVTSYNDSTTCESNKNEVRITIDNIPSPPSISDTGRCGDGSFVLTSTPGIYSTSSRWYAQSTGGILLATSNNYITNHLTGSTSYFVSSYNDSTKCESSREELLAEIDSIPLLPMVNDTSICGYGILNLSGTPGLYANTLKWYNMPGGGNELRRSNNYQTPYLNSSTSYWVSSYNITTQCESQREQMDITINEIPQTTPIQGYEFVRLDQGNVVYSVDYHSGSSYDWIIPAEVTKINEVDNFVILEFPNLGSQLISVTETANNGCVGLPEEKEIVVTNEIINLSIDDYTPETCHENNIALNVIPQGGNAPYFYQWSGDTAYLTDKNRSNPVFIADKPGVFKLNIHVWDIENNHAYDTMAVRVFTNPKVNFNPDELFVCAGSDTMLLPQLSSGSGSYSLFMWSGNTIGLSSVNMVAPTFSAGLVADYQMNLTVMDTRGCVGKDTILVHNVKPEASFTSDTEPKCSPVEISFINTSERAIRYEWDFGDGNTSTDTNTAHTFYNLTTAVQYYETILTAYDEHHCVASEKAFITLYPNPDHSFTINPKSGCDPVQAILTSTPGGFSYQWDYGDGIVQSGNYSTYHEFRNSGEEPLDYKVKLIASSFFGCIDTFYNSLTVMPSPKPDFIATPETQMFPEATVNFSNIPVGDYEYSWQFGDDETFNDIDPVSHEYLYPGNYEISLKMKGKYCSDSISKRITILPHPPIAKFMKVDPGCMPHTVEFKNESSFADNYLWEFGDGAISNKPEPVYTYYEEGVYKVKLTASNKEGLKNISSDVATVYVLPNSFFDLAPKIVFVNDQPVKFFNLSDNGDAFEWTFGDEQNSTEFEPEHLYTTPGTYDVTLKVWTKEGCFDLYEMKSAVVVEESGKIVFPNVIKPLSLIDQNQTFKPAVIDDVDEYHLMIYNRWGELIFESHDQDEGWDGHFDGSPVKSDVYVWKLKGKYVNGRGIDETGDVTVIY